MTIIPTLTWLYAPATRPELLEKAFTSDADVVIVDLEDAVQAVAKSAARSTAIDFLTKSTMRASQASPAIHVRVNPVSTAEGRADLRALWGRPGLAGVRLTKVEHDDDVRLARELLGGVEAPALYCLIESCLGVEHCSSIVRAPGVAGVSLGEGDLAAELGTSTEDALTWFRGRIVCAAAAAGLPPPSMSVFGDIGDDHGLAASCARGRSLGMYGRAAIHPRQLPIIKQAFTPTPGEVAEAKALLEAAEAADGPRSGAFQMSNGRFVDRPVIAAARRIVSLAANPSIDTVKEGR